MKISPFVLFIFYALSFSAQNCTDCTQLYEEKKFEDLVAKVNEMGEKAGIQDLLLMGKSYQTLGRVKDAKRVYSWILLNDEENTEACIAVGALFIDLEEYDNALFATERALKFEPQNKKAKYNMAIAYFHKKDVVKLNEYLDKNLAEEPSNEEFLYIKAIQLMQQEEFENAVSYFEKIEQIDPEFENYSFYYGYSLYKLRKLEEAKVKLNRSVKLDDEQLIDAYYYLAQVNVQLFNKVDACEAYTKAINLGDLAITKEADEYCQEKKTQKIKFRDRGIRVKF